MADSRVASLSLANMWVGFAAFAVAVVLGVYQVVERMDIIPALKSPALYFGSVSTHGVLMGFVLTTFLVVGYGYYTATTSLRQELWSRPLAWFGFWLSLAGVVLAAVPLLTGNASVLYTFYPPLQAHPAFYIGLTLLVVGSWIWSAVILATYRGWRTEHRDTPAPLAAFAIVTTIILISQVAKG